MDDNVQQKKMKMFKSWFAWKANRIELGFFNANVTSKKSNPERNILRGPFHIGLT